MAVNNCGKLFMTCQRLPFLGLAVMVLMIPINGVVASKMKKYQVTNAFTISQSSLA
jgi:hypothetical protein